ncbi:MAG TPA: hypothetical protein VIF62_06400 [Labilithrix sp.]
MRIALFAVILVASCSRNTPPAAREAAKLECDALMKPPVASGAEKLCDEHVAAQDSEIAWTSYGLGEAAPNVVARYREAAARCGVATQEAPFTVAKGDERLSVHDSTSTDYPSCAKKPSPAQKSVLVLSRRTLRGP